MGRLDALYDDSIRIVDEKLDKRPNGGRASSVVKMLASAAVERAAERLPYWKAYGLLPEVYTAFRGGIKEAANQTKHKNGIDAGRLPNWLGFQNLYPILKFREGILDVDGFYTFRRGDTGYETPIDFEGQQKPEPSTANLVDFAEKSIDRERAVGNDTIQAIVAGKHQNGDFLRAACLAEITDMDAKKLPDPGKFKNLYTAYELWLGGQEGKRTKIADTPHGEIYRYDMPTGFEKLKTYTRLDFRYTIRNMPINILKLEDLEMFRGEPLQRMLENIAYGTIQSEKEDYVSASPAGLPLRRDGYVNPIARYMN